MNQLYEASTTTSIDIVRIIMLTPCVGGL